MGIKEKILDFIEKIRTKIEQRKEVSSISKNSMVYYTVALSIVFGYGFFLNSNAILNTHSDLISTPIYQKQNIGTQTIDLRSRKYNPLTHTVEFMFAVENATNSMTEIQNMKLDFEMREKSNPTEKIEVTSRQLDSKNYVVIAKAPSKWTVLSVAVGEKISNPNNKNDDLFQNSSTRFYTNINKIEKDYNLKEKNTNEYLANATENEIKIVDKNIESIYKNIDKEKQNIIDTQKTIDTIEEGKKYQIETELEISNSEIESLKLSIENHNEKIENYKKEIREKANKIEKLKLKKSDYMKK